MSGQRTRVRYWLVDQAGGGHRPSFPIIVTSFTPVTTSSFTIITTSSAGGSTGSTGGSTGGGSTGGSTGQTFNSSDWAIWGTPMIWSTMPQTQGSSGPAGPYDFFIWATPVVWSTGPT